MAVIETERSAGGEVSCLVQFGGQTPLKLALALQEAGVKILGTSPDSIDLAEDRQRFAGLLSELNITQPASGTATSRQEAREVAAVIGFPVVVRPSYVLGGRAMAILYDVGTLDRYMTHAVDASPEHPILVDKFLEDAFEFDVDAIADATGAVVIGGIMEHIEEAGIHSGDSSCVVPPFICPERHLQTIRDHTRRIAKALGVIGLVNVQFAIKDDVGDVLGANPRASRTGPYLSKATLTPIARDRADLGFRLLATRGTAAYLRAYGLDVDVVYKVNEGRPNIADEIVNRKVDLVINTPLGRESFFDDRLVRRAAMTHEVPCITTLTGAAAAVSAIRGLRQQGFGVRALQDYYAGIAAEKV